MKNLLALTIIALICSTNALSLSPVTKNWNWNFRKVNLNQWKEQYINSLWHESDVEMIVSKSPYTIERCDVTVALDSAEFIADQDDYTVRKPSYITISAYHLNVFESKDPASLEGSILFSNSRSAPKEPVGAQNCLLVDGGEIEKSLLFCAKNQGEFENYKTVIKTFEECRAWKVISKPGDKKDEAQEEAPLPPIPTKVPTLAEVSKKCGFEGPVNPAEILAKSSENKPEPKKEGWEDDFWIPGGHKVPGTKGDQESK